LSHNGFDFILQIYQSHSYLEPTHLLLLLVANFSSFSSYSYVFRGLIWSLKYCPESLHLITLHSSYHLTLSQAIIYLFCGKLITHFFHWITKRYDSSILFKVLFHEIFSEYMNTFQLEDEKKYKLNVLSIPISYFLWELSLPK
jgi:hypothetical protein